MSSLDQKYNVVFILGPPGSGKGTQCQDLEKNLGFVHLSAGDLLRAERERVGSAVGQLIEKHISEGTIVPIEITCKLLENAMQASGDARGFLIDGFPRNRENLDGWTKEMSNKVDVKFVLSMSCPVQTCIDRCLHRGQGRTDDNEESLRKRINTYNDSTLPVIQHFDTLGLVREVVTDRPKEEVYSDIVEVFSNAGFSNVSDNTFLF